MYLADTNVISELMRPQPDSGVWGWMDSLAPVGARVGVSAVTVDELIFGLTRRPRAVAFVKFERWIGLCKVVPVDEAIARRAGELRAVLSLRGQVRSQPDMLIAATAQVHALTLVTRNVRDFDGCGIAVLNPFEGG